MNHGPGALNRIFRLVWSDASGGYVAVAENAKGRGKRSSGVAGALVAAGGVALSAGAFAAGPAPGALPTGGTVSAGQATIQQSGAQMTINQGSQRAVVDWNTFNIGSNASVQFKQPGTSSVALNRVNSPDASQIFGRLSANGQVLLVNPNGIVFGAGSQVDAAGIAASTLRISNADFMAGKLKFTRDGVAGSIVNQGTLNATDGGYVALLAPEVRNEGVISAQLGTVALAAGDAVTLTVDGNQMIGIKVDPATIDTLVENGQMIRAEGGQVILSAGAANRLLQQAVATNQPAAGGLVVENGVARLVSAGGTIAAAQVKVEGSMVDVSGAIDASGATGGTVAVSADFATQSGTLRADGSQGAGGNVSLASTTVVQTASAVMSADGATSGGTVALGGATTGSLSADGHGRVYSSATLQARGGHATGGHIDVTADSVQLRAATLDASGLTGGGTLRVGGGFHGSDSGIANAVETGINGTTLLRADAIQSGNGGQVAVWSDGTTTFAGQLSAKGGATQGNGGTAEVSGKGLLTFGGKVDLSAPAGQNGQLSLDPRDIVIDDAAAAIVSLDLDDPLVDNVSHANGFGSSVKTLANGNVLVTASTTSVTIGPNSLAKAGAVYLYNSRTGALLNQLYGTHANDQVGSGGVQLLANGNYLVLSPLWNPNAASATYYSSYYGTLTKTTATGATAGAITWQNGTPTGSTGSTVPASSAAAYVDATTSLVGSNLTNDRIGDTQTTTLTTLSDGNLAIATPSWNNGRGAVTWMNTSTGQYGNGSVGGAISASTSFVGSTAIRDTAIVESVNGHNFYVTDYQSAGPTSVYDPANHSNHIDPATLGAGDGIGSSIVLLANGNFAIVSPNWTNGSNSGAYAGAVTWDGSGHRIGTVGAANSLVGTHQYDAVGSGGVTAVGTIPNGETLGSNYIVASPYWKDDATDSSISGSRFFTSGKSQGAVTWVDGSNGWINNTASVGATVSDIDSLHGNTGSLFGSVSNGSGGYTWQTNYNGGYNTDYNVRQVAGSSGVRVLGNGNVVVNSNVWNGNAGSVTLIQGDSGTVGAHFNLATGAVSASNSLVGASGGDSIGSTSITELSSHNIVVNSNGFGGGKGAVTLINGTTGDIGGEAPGTFGAVVSATNSLVGSTGADNVGSGGIVGVGAFDATTNLWSNYLVLSPVWGNSGDNSGFGSATNRYGAVTFGDGAAGVQGVVSAANSLVGSHAGDYVGSFHASNSRSSNAVYAGQYFDGLYTSFGAWSANLSATVDVLANGDYVVRSSGYDGGKGAATFGSGTSGVSGTVGAGNSLVGSIADVVSTSTATNTHQDGRSYVDTTYTMTTVGDHVGLLGTGLANGSYLVASPFWNGGRGALTSIGTGGSNNTGAVDATNSLVGSTADVYSTTAMNVAGVGDRSLAGNASVLPIYALTSGDHLGASFSATTYFNQVSSVLAGDSSKGTTTMLSMAPALMTYVNPISQSLSNQSKRTGSSFGTTTPNLAVATLTDGSLLIGSGDWNNGSAVQAGAVTRVTPNGVGNGVLGSSNSLVADHAFDNFGNGLSNYNNGYGGAQSAITYALNLASGNFVLFSSGWGNGRTMDASTRAITGSTDNGLGEATFANIGNALIGTISAGNSLVGSQAGDRVSSTGLIALGNGSYVVGSATWANGSAANAGAVTWGSVGSGVQGVVSAANSLVGSHSGDAVGSTWYGSGLTELSDGNYLVSSVNWANGSASNAGAVTWVDGNSGHLFGSGAAGGVVSAANSLVGSHNGDYVGSDGVTLLPNGRYVIGSAYWSNGSEGGAGAATFGQAGGVAGAVSAANSLVGSLANSNVGSNGSIVLLTDQNGTYTNYLVKSTSWGNPLTGDEYVGAVTWVDGTTGHAHGESGTGAVISAANSLIGTGQYNFFGGNVMQLTTVVGGNTVNTGDLLIYSDSTQVGDQRGSVTLLPGSSGIAGDISWRNSIIGFNDSQQRHTGSLQYTTLAYGASSSELVAYRPLIWTSGNSDNSSLKVLSVVDESLSTPLGAVGATPSSHAAGDGTQWASNGAFIGDASTLASYGFSNGLLAFSASNGTDNLVITPGTLTSLLNAGTDVTLQANNDITVLKPIVVSAGGHGGSLTLEAGRSITLKADIDTDGGDFTAIANQTHAAGVVNNSGLNTNLAQQRDSDAAGAATLTMADGVSIDAGTGDVSLQLMASNDKSKTVQYWNGSAFATHTLTGNASGDIVLGNIAAANFLADNWGGSNSLSGDVLSNAASSLALSLNGDGHGLFAVRAWNDVVLGRNLTPQSVSVDRANGSNGALDLVLQSDQGGSGDGIVVLSTATVNTHGGDIVAGGGLAVDADLRPTGLAQASGSGSVNGFARTVGVLVNGTSTLDAGNGNVSLAGRANGSTGIGLSIAGSGAATLVNGAQVTLTGERALGGSSGTAINLSDAQIGSATDTQSVVLKASGFDNTTSGHGSLMLANDVSLTGASGSTLQLASDVAGSVLQIGGTTASNNSGFWLAGDNGSGSGSQFGTLLRAAQGFGEVSFGDTAQTAATLVQNLALTHWMSGNAFASDLTIEGGSGGVTFSGSTDLSGLATGQRTTVSVQGSGAIAFGTSSFNASDLTLASSGAGSITQAGGGTLQAQQLLLDAASASLALNGTANAIGTIAGHIGSGQLIDAQTLHVGSLHGAAGLESDGSLLLKTTGASSDLVLDNAVTSDLGNLTLVAGRDFINNTPLDTGLAAANGQYWVYNTQPTLRNDGADARGMTSGFSKHYAQGYTGSTPGYATSGNWFFYSIAPNVTVSLGSGNTTIEYGQSANTYGYGFSGFIGGDNRNTAGLTGALAYTVDGFTATGAGYRPVGTYNATLSGIGTLASTLGYTFTVVNGSNSITVAPKTLTTDGSRMYDGTTTVDAASLGALSGVLAGDTASVKSGSVGSVASPHAGAAQAIGFVNPLQGADAANYQLAGALTITPRTIAVLADASSMIYGDANPALGYHVGGAGLASGDTAGAIFSGALSSAQGAAATAGTHAIEQGTLANTSGDYTVSGYTGATLTVAPRQITFTADDQSKVYGNADPALSYTIGGAGLASWDTQATALSGALATTTGAQATAGTHAITQGDLAANANYTVSGYTPGTLSVSPRAIAVAADAQSMVYGNADPALSYRISAGSLAAWDSDASVFSGALAAPKGAAATVGNQAITQGSLAANSNYTLSAFEAATLAVSPRPIKVTADNVAKVPGQPDPTLSFQVGPDGLAAWDSNASVFSGSLSGLDAVGPGLHPITQGTLAANANYAMSFVPGSLVIPAPATLGSETLLAQAAPQQRQAVTPALLPQPGAAAPAVDAPGSLRVVGGGLAAATPNAIVGSTQGLSAQPQLADVSMKAGAPVSVTLPANAFTQSIAAPLQLSATQAGGSPLPGWLSFDAATMSFSGQPPAGFSGTVTVSVTAVDAAGNSATTQMKLVFGDEQ